MIFPINGFFFRRINLLTPLVEPIPQLLHVLFNRPYRRRGLRVRVRLYVFEYFFVPHEPDCLPRLLSYQEALLPRILQGVSCREGDQIAGMQLEEGGVEVVVELQCLVVDVCD